MSIEMVKEFNEKFGFPNGDHDILTGDYQAEKHRVDFLSEELNELWVAFIKSDKIGAFDALLDLVYVAQGTALFMGISPAEWNAGMAAVHKANMAKVRVENVSESKRKMPYDARKPDGWVGPEEMLASIIKIRRG